MTITIAQDVQASLAAALAFWYALRDDENDTAILARVTPRARRRLAGVVGIAEYVRGELLGIEVETIGRLETLDQVERHAGGLLRFRFSLTGRFVRRVDAGEESLFWRLDLELHDGRWLVDPIRKDGGPLLETLLFNASTVEATRADPVGSPK